ncbi:alpha/beta fold hydrolase [Shewanella avicenniae]|uniref:Alpha/beta fold hydrolase n=1 Tax=Shewanella avicenniae TaxID=2814294 RepID=A0ABX7QLA9_9GAMM|nr:alpha/beta fold hydrolase [Shewanella avicenniae]QSX32247.1 alpha/beta fold hydrolase [Shewanella avicenniae]
MDAQIHIAGAVAYKHFFDLPLDYQSPEKCIRIFAREVRGLQAGAENLPFLVFFQGGPGFGAMRPGANSGWLKRALTEFRVLLLDQRGTGLSSPISYASLQQLTPAQQAEYLQHFRADNIVRDAEAIRQQLSPDQPWSALGQSFGGFCILHYLSVAPEGLKQAFITGGIPSLTRSAAEVYQATFKRVLQKNRDFFNRFSDARALTQQLVSYLRQHQVLLPNGDTLSVEMLQLLGIHLGMEQGAETLYYLLEQALIDTPSGQQLNPLFLAQVNELLSYHTNPIYAILHEAIYCQTDASQWAAHQVRQSLPEFATDAEELLFTGEMVFPWMFKQINWLTPLAEAAELLAHKADWPTLYDLDQLAQNKVPVAAAIYSNDMYVERQFSEETAALVANMHTWVTSEYEHNGIRMDGEHILNKLIALVRGEQLR